MITRREYQAIAMLAGFFGIVFVPGYLIMTGFRELLWWSMAISAGTVAIVLGSLIKQGSRYSYRWKGRILEIPPFHAAITALGGFTALAIVIYLIGLELKANYCTFLIASLFVEGAGVYLFWSLYTTAHRTA